MTKPPRKARWPNSHIVPRPKRWRDVLRFVCGLLLIAVGAALWWFFVWVFSAMFEGHP